MVTLSVTDGETVVGYVFCDTHWYDVEISVSCDVPAVSRAGYWQLSVTLDDELVQDGLQAVAIAGAVAHKSYLVLNDGLKPILGQTWDGVAMIYPVDVEGEPLAESGPVRVSEVEGRSV